MHKFFVIEELFDREVVISCNEMSIDVGINPHRVKTVNGLEAFGYFGVIQEPCISVEGEAVEYIFIRPRHIRPLEDIHRGETLVTIYKVRSHSIWRDESREPEPIDMRTLGVGRLVPSTGVS